MIQNKILALLKVSSKPVALLDIQRELTKSKGPIKPSGRAIRKACVRMTLDGLILRTESGAFVIGKKNERR